MSTGTMLKTEATAQGPATSQPGTAARGGLGWYFGFFFLSGLCSILYELIWLRLAMAQFGVTSAMVSIVLSSFMAGLGVGSWASGYLVRNYGRRLTFPPLHLYALTEIVIGCSALVVPLELLAGRYVLEHVGATLSLSSAGYYVAAGVWLACTLIPWCASMGATIPLGMFAIRSDKRLEPRRSFSFLYLANVLGAVAGTLVPLILVEIWGFHRTLQVGMLLNVAICAAAYRLAGHRAGQAEANPVGDDVGVDQHAAPVCSVSLRQMLGNSRLWLLFATGLTSMAMEVVWARQYTIFIGTFVYSFALILGSYLAATFLGSMVYRVWSRRHQGDGSLVWLLVWLAALIPLLTADPRVGISKWLRVPVGIAGFSALLGFVTPGLVDRYSDGDPNRAGVGYAVNVAGCILGPLLAGFVLLPYLDERYSVVALAVPWLVAGAGFAFARQPGRAKRLNLRAALAACLVSAVSAPLIVRTRSYVEEIAGGQVRRDSTATVVAAGTGMNKQLFVNGVSMTYLTPITKIMASMPLAFLDRPPQNALVICFGMGTTHRSMLSWGIDSTAVDLVPSVPAFFSYYHADAPLWANSPHSHVVADDGRRFLERTTEQYDVIVIDPPPPIAAAGSSLLYSREFYSEALRRLRPDGILEQWFPSGDAATTAAIARALKESFPYLRAFGSFEGWGIHYLASRRPIASRTARELANQMPPNAAEDLVEWGPFSTPEQQFAAVLKNEISIDGLISLDQNAPALQDDRPVNEYGLLRHTRFWPH